MNNKIDIKKKLEMRQDERLKASLPQIFEGLSELIALCQQPQPSGWNLAFDYSDAGKVTAFVFSPVEKGETADFPMK
jgi:hypothetical protein